MLDAKEQLKTPHGKYLYCIIKGNVPPDRFQLKGVEGKNAYALNHGDLACLMSDASNQYYPLWREHIIAHQKPIEEVMKYYAVLPFSFSTIADTEDQIREEILAKRSSELQELFQKFDGKTEMDVKAFWPDMKPVFQDIAEQSQELKRLKNNSRLSYQQHIAAGELVKKLIEQKKKTRAEKILNIMKEYAADVKELQCVGEAMVFDAAFLIKKERENEFAKHLARTARYFSDMKFRYSGPFPLYNFANLKIHLASYVPH